VTLVLDALGVNERQEQWRWLEWHGLAQAARSGTPKSPVGTAGWNHGHSSPSPCPSLCSQTSPAAGPPSQPATREPSQSRLQVSQ